MRQVRECVCVPTSTHNDLLSCFLVHKMFDKVVNHCEVGWSW